MQIRVRHVDNYNEWLIFTAGDSMKIKEGTDRDSIRADKDLYYIFNKNGLYLGYGITDSNPFELASEAIARIEAERVKA